jgi:hypothetical protein
MKNNNEDVAGCIFPLILFMIACIACMVYVVVECIITN